jgi:polar amino acid transport system substrate-binding protein
VRSVLRFFVCSLLVALVWGAPFAHAQAKSASLPPLRVGMEGAKPPFNVLVRAQRLTPVQFSGFEVDLIQALCEQMQRTCVFKQKSWDRLIPSLLAGQIDVIFSAMPITEERQLRIAFSKPYYRIPAAFLQAKSGTFETSPAGLKDKAIGTLADGGHTDYLAVRYPSSTIKTYNNLEEAYLDMQSNRIDLMFADQLSLQSFLKTPLGERCIVIGEPHYDVDIYGEGVAAGFRPEDPELKQKFDSALADFIKDGSFARLNARYFPFSLRSLF